METTKHQLPEDVQIFLTNLKHYLDKPLYFYGSIQRSDFISGSDLDICIFTDNENSTIEKLSHYLNTPKYKFKKIILKYSKDHTIIYGHKLVYVTTDISLPIEFAIYNEKNKIKILHDNNSRVILPVYASFLLIILKTIFYKLHLINIKTYAKLKEFCFTTLIGKEKNTFIKI